MHRLPRRSISALLRSGGSLYRNATAPISSFNVFQQAVEEKIDNVRRYSVLTAENRYLANFSKTFDRESDPCLGIRYKSTTAATETSNPPSERYVYQAEVPKLVSAAEYFFKSEAEGKRFRPTVLLLMATAIDTPISRLFPDTPDDTLSTELRTRQKCIAEITEMTHP